MDIINMKFQRYFQSLLEYKAMNVERQCRIFVEPWSDSMHTALWRNDGFLHLFHDLSKSNAFSENSKRMKFILHKIFFRISILSSSKTLWMFFNSHSKMTRLNFQLNNYYCHDTGHNFEFIFMKFTWLVRVHAQVNLFFFSFGNNRSNRTTDMGENVPRNWFFGFHSASMGFFEEKISKLYSVPNFSRKKLYSFSRTPKIIFCGYFGKYCFS